MTNIVLFILGFFYIVIAILMCIQESNNRKINFWVALLLCIVITPFFAYFIIGLLPLRNPRGCNWVEIRKTKLNTAAYVEKMKRVS
jgi:hypothetical protein